MARLARSEDGQGKLIWSQEMLRANNMLEGCEKALFKNPGHTTLYPKKEFLAELRRKFYLGDDFTEGEIWELQRLWEKY